MWRLIGGVVAGLVAWIVIVSLLDRAMRYGWHDYAAVGKGHDVYGRNDDCAACRMSAVSSLASGYVAALVGKGGWAPLLCRNDRSAAYVLSRIIIRSGAISRSGIT
jgi:hypothetical protein